MKIRFLSLSFLGMLVISLLTFHTTALATEISSTESKSETKNEVKINAYDISIVTGNDFTLKLYNLPEDGKISFKSDDEEVATVSKLGKITAEKVGSTVITTTIKSKQSSEDIIFKCSVYVGPPAISVRLTLSNITLEVGKKKTLQSILKPNTTAESPVFSSYDPDIATVSATGKVTAKKPGTTYILSRIENGKYDLCTINVIESAEVHSNKN